MEKSFGAGSMDPLILAIDTSCDDTSVAVVSGIYLISNIIASQTQLHKQYGGVFPTVAKQAHKENLEPSIQLALKRAGVTMNDIAAVAVTQGPGLAPALEVGITRAKSLATEYNLPLIPVNHIEGHALSPLVTGLSKKTEIHNLAEILPKVKFPFLSLVISGGHTEFILIKAFGEYERIGYTIDDAAGEALDKFGRMVDLGYPAGALVEEFAKKGDAKRFPFPLPMTTSGNANMSFSGLKTSARNLTEELKAKGPLSQQDIYDLCASFQYAVFHAVTYKLKKVLETTSVVTVLLGGGVAANMTLRKMIREVVEPYDLNLYTPYTKKLCMDNAAMIGIVASLKFAQKKSFGDPQAIERIPRWKVDQV